MFAEASPRLRTQAGAILSATPRTLSILLNLCLNPATDRQKLVHAVEADPAILAEFLGTETPTRLVSWHLPFDRIHFLCTAAKLSIQYAQQPLSSKQWQTLNSRWQLNQRQGCIAANLARTSEQVLVHEAKLTALLASIADPLAVTLPQIPREAIRFQHAPADSLADTHALIRIVSATMQLAKIQKIDQLPSGDEFLKPWGFKNVDAGNILKAAENDLQLLQANATEASADQYETDLQNLNLALRAYEFKTLLDQQLTAGHSIEADIRRLGASLFDLHHCCLFTPTDSGFAYKATRITSPDSLIIKAVQSRSRVTSADTAMLVVDQQILETCNSTYLLALPIMNNGIVIAVLVAGIQDDKAQGLDIFAASIAEAMVKAGDRITVEQVQRKAKKITHEVNNPLAIVQNYLKILSLKLGDGHEAQGAINTISGEILRAAEIIKRYSHIGDDLQSQSAVTDCNDIIAEITEMFAGGYPDISFTGELDKKHPLVNLEPDQFRQILVNLLKNAIEAMASQGEITICSSADVVYPNAKYVEIEIADSGPGIAHEIREDLFVPGVTTKSEDSGLGLSIVSEIISAADGMISFRTGATGTSFRLLLPHTESVNQKEPS